MKHPDEQGRFSLHGSKYGTPSPDQVEARARELAELDGRHPDDVTDQDRQRARRDLTGQTEPFTVNSEAESDTELTRNPGDPPSQHGKQAPRVEAPDEQVHPEQQAREGVRDAHHDRALEAERERKEGKDRSNEAA